MKFCTNCGNQIDDNAIFCSSCGARVNGDDVSFDNRGGFYGGYQGGYGGGFYGGYQTYPVYDHRESILVSILSFFSWQIGFVLWLVWRRTRPGKAHSAMKGLCSGASFSLPLFGFLLCLLWRDEEENREYVNLSKIFAIIGAAGYALLIIAAIVFVCAANTLPDSSIGDAMASIFAYFG